MKKQSFAAGAAILMIANAVSKILGAAFKIPLTYILREDGMAVYNTAFSVYVMFLSLVVSGIPTAVSKTVARSDLKSALRITDTSEKVLFVIGAAASAALYFGAEFFAFAMKENRAVMAIRLIAPSVLLVALGTGCKSFFHGSSAMTAPAVSQIAEAVVKLGAGYILAVMLIGIGTDAAASGAIAGVTVGEFIATAILVTAYIMVRKRLRIRSSRTAKQETLKNLLSAALPLLLAEAALNAVSVVDTSVLRSRLLVSGLSDENARFLYGSFTGYALTIFNLPVGILATIGISLLPPAAAAAAHGDMRRAAKTLNSGAALTLFISVPAAVILLLMPNELLTLLFHNTTSAHMLRLMAPCVISVSLVQLLSAFIQATGNAVLPPVFITGALIVKILIMWVLCAMPQYHIYGAAAASNAAYLLALAADLIAVRVITGTVPNFLGVLAVPCLASAAMAAAVVYLRPMLGSSSIGIIILCALCAVTYLATAGILHLILRCFRKDTEKRRCIHRM